MSNRDDPRLQGMDVRYGGRTLRVEILINTDESESVVAQRVQAAAKGPKACMAVVSVGTCDPDEAAVVWERLIAASRAHVNREGKA